MIEGESHNLSPVTGVAVGAAVSAYFGLLITHDSSHRRAGQSVWGAMVAVDCRLWTSGAKATVKEVEDAALRCSSAWQPTSTLRPEL